MVKIWNPDKHPVLRDVAMIILVIVWLFGWVMIAWGFTGSGARFVVQGAVIVVCIGIVLVQGWRRRRGVR